MKMLLVELLEGWNDVDDAIDDANRLMQFYLNNILDKFIETKHIKLENKFRLGDLYIIFKEVEDEDEIRTRASYVIGEKKIIIYLFPDDKETIVNAITAKNSDINGMMREVKSITSTLAHEIQHHKDNVKSDGKFVKSKKAYNYSIHPNDNSYYRLPHEIWARMTEALYSINELEIKNVREYIEEFKKEFVAWDRLTENDKKKLIKNVYKYYKEIYEPSMNS